MTGIPPDHLRGLRGVVRHLVRPFRPPAELPRFAPRDPLGWKLQARYGEKQTGICVWCGLPTFHPHGRKLRWHATCVLYHAAARGTTVAPDGRRLIERASCEECGLDWTPAHEVDHRVAVSVAVRQGYRAYARALTPGNLRWLCRPCHKIKTKHDTRARIELDGGYKKPPAPPPHQYDRLPL